MENKIKIEKKLLKIKEKKKVCGNSLNNHWKISQKKCNQMKIVCHSSLHCEYCVQFQRKQDSSYTKVKTQQKNKGNFLLLRFSLSKLNQETQY